MEKKLHLILCWHMHQPDYRNLTTGEFTLPWTYLHATKDYTDMAWHLEQGKVKAVVNFVPVLLDQLEDYARQFKEGKVRDPLLSLLPRDDLESLAAEERQLILDSCFRSDHAKMIEPYPPYRRLFELYKLIQGPGGSRQEYLSPQYMADLLVWYHLVWMGETVRRESDLVARLMAQGCGFTASDRGQLYQLIGELIGNLVPRYRKLAQSGRVELSSTPYHHPIAPLLIDFKSARESNPGSSLPDSPAYPGGRTRVVAHIQAACESHRRRFGAKPVGMWPAEGGVSMETLRLMAEHGCRWAATGQGVLVNSLHATGHDAALPEKHAYLYRPYQVDGLDGLTCFFRDDTLSDLIGFEYAKWYGSDAVSHFIQQLEAIWRNTPEREEPVVSVIMDGENAWEYYPYNGYYFLSGLYAALQNHPFIRATTFRDYLEFCAERETHADRALPCAERGFLPKLTAGSWVYGNFSTWIGDPAKNRAWDLLCAAKASFDMVMASGRLTAEEQGAARGHLSDCEGSDWFWWFGDYNPEISVSSFDKLFRDNLAILYELLKLPPPPDLKRPICRGSSGEVEAGGTMRRST